MLQRYIKEKVVHKHILFWQSIFFFFFHIYHLWGSKIWAHDLGPGTTFNQQYARGEEITEDRCN